MEEIIITMNETIRGAENESCAQVVIVNKDGSKKSRFVTIESLVKALCSSVVAEEKFFEIGAIPFGYYDARVGEDKGKFSANFVAVLPPGRQMMTYEQTMYDVSLPGLVFSFRVIGEMLISTHVYVTPDEKPTPKSKLYRYPFGNVNTDGSVCWGQNKVPRIRSLKGFEELMLLFIHTPTNSDYYNGQSYCNHAELSLRQLYEFLKDQEEYPKDYLVPLKKGNKQRCLKDLTPWRK